ncbi:protein trichome birefringence-like 2 [Papaver somniferum]|uniref:protein trichome birefringence-like 2 n=1 Tax=Papaver somniferum TaxID=3469 RepID=UPI000E6F78CF|nr:protein trichome birefringence-like 2 [Papaver somniferum]
MRNLKVWDKSCHFLTVPSHHHSKRYGSSMLLRFGFILGASIFLLTATIFIFPSVMDSMFWIPNAHTSSDTTSFSAVPTELLENSTGTVQTETNLMETSFTNSSVVSTDLPNDGEFIDRNDGQIANISYRKCDIFEGEWVKVNGRKPYYPPGSCPYLKKQPFACYQNGRPDDQFLGWQWQWQSQETNAGCDNIPNPGLFNPIDFLNRLRDKKLVFVGDSLNRNMFMSMLCMLWNAIPDKSRIVKLHREIEFKIRGDYSRRYKDYNCSVVFVWSPYLVYEANPRSRRSKNILHLGPHTLRLDLIDELAASVYRDADIVVFDSWHWWNVDKTNHGENIFQEGDYLHPKLEINEAYKKALTTWRKWIDNNVDSTRTQIVFRGYSVSHYVGGKWNTGGKCDRETEPIMSKETYMERSPLQVKILEDVLREMKSPVLYLNVSKLTYYRADAHPSVYAKNYSVQERTVALDHQDCSHWCLPGVPDTWNELLYVSLLKARKGSFGRQ